MAKTKNPQVGDILTQTMIDRNGVEHQIKSKVIGKPGQPKKISEVTGPKTDPESPKK